MLIGGRYEVVGRLGVGGMGEVGLAVDTWRDGRRVALKWASLRDAERRAALEREFRRLVELRHPRIVRAREFGTCLEAGRVFFTMEHVDGPDAVAATEHGSTLDRLQVLVDVARALDFLHSRGLVHRDVKAENVAVLEEDGAMRATLLDFGLCAGSGERGGGDSERDGSFSGTFSHAAPEVFADRVVDPRSDLYALGVLAWQVHARRLPFDEHDPVALAEAHRARRPPSLKSAAPDVPSEVTALVDALLAKAPEDRPASAAEVAERLVAADEGLAPSDGASLLAHVRAPRLIGQADASARAEDLLDALRARRASEPLLLLGAGGVGKTRLLEWLQVEAQLARCHVLAGRCAPDGDPWSGLSEPVREAVRHHGPRSELVRRLLPDLVKVAPELGGAAVGPRPELSAEDERTRLAAAMTSLFLEAAERPLLLAIDGVEHASPAVAWALGFLARSARRRDGGGRLAIALAGRDAEALQESVRDGVSVAELRSLDEASTRAHLDACLPDLHDAARIAERLHAGVGGTPRALEQWLARLVRRGALRRHADGWHLDESASAFQAPPESARAGVVELIASLPDEARRLLLVAALAVEPVEHHALAVAAGVHRSRAGELLDDLEALELVAAPARPDGRAVALPSQLVHEAALESADAGELRRLAVEALERVLSTVDLGDVAHAELAEVAGRRDEALRAWRRALDAALERGDAPRQARFAHRLAAIARGAQRREAWRLRAAALLRTERNVEALDALTEAGDEGGVEERVEHRLLAARIHRARGEAESEAAAARSVLDLVGEAHPRAWEAKLQLARASTALDAPGAPELVEEICRDGPGPEVRGRGELLAAGSALRAQDPDRAIARLQRARVLLESATGDVAAAALDSCMSNLGVALMQKGRLDEAAAAMDEALAMRRRRGARAGQGALEVNAAVLAISRERPEEARAHASAGAEILGEVGNVAGEALAWLNFGIAASSCHDVRAARGALARARECNERVGDSRVDEGALHLDASLREAVGDTAGAERACTLLIERLGGSDRRVRRAAAELLRAQVLARLGRGAAARELARTLLAHSAAEEHHADAALLAVEQCVRSEATWRTPVGRVEPPGEQRVEPPGEQRVEPPGEPRVEPPGEQRVEPPGEQRVEPPGEQRVELPALRELWHEMRRAASLARATGHLQPRAACHLALAAAWGRAAGGPDAERRWRHHRRHVARALRLARRSPSRHSRLESRFAAAWTAAREGRLERAEARLEAIVAELAAWLELVPCDAREVFLADSRRRGVREALLAVRAERMRREAEADFFAVVRGRDAAPARGAAPGRRGGGDEAARLREVLEIGSRLNRLAPVPELLDRVLESVLRFIDAERGFLVLTEEGGEEHHFAASRDRSGRSVPRARFAVSRSVLAEVVRTAQPVITSDARGDERFTSKESVIALDLHSVLVAPLVARDRVLGALYVDNSTASAAFDDDDLDLLMRFASQAAVAVDNARLHETTLEKERLDHELRVAHAIQQGLLPRAPPRGASFAVAATMQPANEIGGDYYDFIALPDGRFRVAVGDVSGKGVPAGLFMVMARTILRSIGADDEPLDRLLARANASLRPQIESDKFMTMALLEPRSDGTAVLTCLAGHEPPLVWRAVSRAIESLEPGGVALGMLDDLAPHLEEVEVPMAAGDVLACYSDGVIDCLDAAGERFGRQRLADVLATSAARGARAVVAAVIDALASHRGSRAAADDVTLVVLEATPRTVRGAPGGTAS